MTMTLAEIRAASAKQLATERRDASDTKETTPPTITPAITAFADSLDADKAQFIPVISDPHGLYGWCSDGVLEKVKHDGGCCIFGWTIWEWPNVLLTAEFHTVWEDSNGDRFDITPKPNNERQILFVADTSYAEDFNFDHRPRNRRTRLYVGIDSAEVAATAKMRLTDGQRKYEEKRAQRAGMSLDDWLIAKVPLDPLAKLIDDIIDACNEFEEHFDSLGVAGTVEVDTKFQRLALRRFNLQQQLRRQLKGS